MAEPHNTPVPGSTPRATSPVHGVVLHHHHHHHHPPPPSPPEPSSHPSARSSTRPLILHLGDPILSSITNPHSNASPYEELTARYQVLYPPAQDRQRAHFLQALRDRTWGDFVAVIRPSRDASGDGEMGDWDAELVDSLPASVRVVASAAPGGEGVDVRRLKERGIVFCNGGDKRADADAVSVTASDHGPRADIEDLCVRKVMAVLDGGEPLSAIGNTEGLSQHPSN